MVWTNKKTYNKKNTKQFLYKIHQTTLIKKICHPNNDRNCPGKSKLLDAANLNIY